MQSVCKGVCQASTTASKGLFVRTLFIHKWRSFKRWQAQEKEKAKYEDELQRVKNYMRISDDLYISPERVEDGMLVVCVIFDNTYLLISVLPKKALPDQTRQESGAMSMEVLTNHTMMRYVDHSFDNIRRYNEYQHFVGLQFDQRLENSS